MTQKMGIFSLVGGLGAAVGASLCCLGPLVLLMLGISGSWVANLTILEAYRPILIVVTVLFLFLAYWQIFRPFKAQTCEHGTACAEPRIQRKYQILFWFVVVICVLSLGSPYFMPLFF